MQTRRVFFFSLFILARFFFFFFFICFSASEEILQKDTRYFARMGTPNALRGQRHARWKILRGRELLRGNREK